MTVNVSILERAKAFSKKYGVPITKNQFEGTLDDPVPELPYMVWLSSHETGRGADGFNNLKAQDVDFELYTQQDNQEREDLAKAFEAEVLQDVEYKLFEEHHEYLLIGSTVYVVFPFRFLPMLHGLCLYQVIVNHGQERFALYCVIFLFFLYFGLWYFRYRLLF